MIQANHVKEQGATRAIEALKAAGFKMAAKQHSCYEVCLDTEVAGGTFEIRIESDVTLPLEVGDFVFVNQKINSGYGTVVKGGKENKRTKRRVLGVCQITAFGDEIDRHRLTVTPVLGRCKMYTQDGRELGGEEFTDVRVYKFAVWAKLDSLGEDVSELEAYVKAHPFQ